MVQAHVGRGNFCSIVANRRQPQHGREGGGWGGVLASCIAEVACMTIEERKNDENKDGTPVV